MSVAGDVAGVLADEILVTWLNWRWWRNWIVVILLVLAGSWLYWQMTWDDTDETQSRTGEANSDTDWRHYSVVAPIDTGINVLSLIHI